MCYTTVTHFSRCSHRTSTISLCPRSTQHRPTSYHPPTRHARPCVTNGREGRIFVCCDELCGACSRVNFWFAGGGSGRSNNRTTRDEHGVRRKKNKGPAEHMAAGGPPYHHHPSATQGRSVPRPGPAESTYPIPTGVPGDGRCPLSEAFERGVTIGGGADARPNGSQGVSGGEGEGDGMDRSRTRKQKGEYGPFKPPHFSSDARNRSGGLFGGGLSWSGGYGGYARRTRHRTAGKKQVRFAPKVEVLYFRRDWATTTLRSLSREYKGRR